MNPVPFSSFLRRNWIFFLLLWLGALIANPIGIWVGGEVVFPTLASLGVAAQFIAVLAALSYSQTLRRLGAAVIIIAGVTWTAELVGSQTGIPFGRYHYTPRLQPQIGGVPLIIPLAWTMMLLPAWAVASFLLERFGLKPDRANAALLAFLTGLAFTAWDLYLDPFMVSHRLWVWDQPGAYFGIPLINFFGWWLTAALAVLLVRVLIPDFQPAGHARNRLILIYCLTWIFQAIGSGLFWNQPGPALAGFLGMGIFAFPAVWGLRRSVPLFFSSRDSISLVGKET